MKPWWLHSGSLRAPADDFGLGSDGADDNESNLDDDEDDFLDDDDDEVEEESSDESPAPKPRAPRQTAPTIGLSELTAALKEALPSSPQRQLSQQEAEAELERLVGKVEVTEDLVAALRDPEVPAPKALQLLGGLLKAQEQRILKMAGLAMQNEFGKISPELDGLKKAQAQAQAEDWVRKTVRQFPALKGRERVVREALAQVGQSGYRPVSMTDALRKIAQTAKERIRAIDPNFRLKVKQGQEPPPGRGASGGRAGGSGKGRPGDDIINMHFGARR